MSFSTNSNTKKHISCYNSNPITVSSSTLLSIELLDCKVSEMLQLRNHENQSLLHYVQRMLDPLEKQTKKNWRSVGQTLSLELQRKINFSISFPYFYQTCKSIVGRLLVQWLKLDLVSQPNVTGLIQLTLETEIDKKWTARV